MRAVGRWLTFVVAVLLVVAVWAILVAPDYDLEPTLLRGKLALALFLYAVPALAGVSPLLRWRRQSPWSAPPEAVSSLLELTCARLC